MRVIVRRERPHPGAQLSLFEENDGWRYQAFATNTTAGALQFLEARHRAHARVEDRIRHAKDTGLGRLPSREYKINQAWLAAVAIAADLTAWLRLLALSAALAACEPKALRLPATARTRLDHPRWPATGAAVSQDLALGAGRRRRLRAHRCHPASRLTVLSTLDPEPLETRTAAPRGAPLYPPAGPGHSPHPTCSPSRHHDLMKDGGKDP